MLGNWGLQRGGEGTGRSKELMLDGGGLAETPAWHLLRGAVPAGSAGQPPTYTPEGLAGGPTQGRPPAQADPPPASGDTVPTARSPAGHIRSR